MSGRLPDVVSEHEFDDHEKSVITALLNRIVDDLLRDHNLLLTKLHYPARYSRSQNSNEQFGLMLPRDKPTSDRPQIMLTRCMGSINASFEIDHGQLTEAEKAFPNALELKKIQFPPARSSYGFVDTHVERMYREFKHFLLTREVPMTALRS